MSNLDTAPDLLTCGGWREVPVEPTRQLLTGRVVPLGESTRVRRLLPTMGRRMVGAWCFVDHYGPDDITAQPGMQVPPHPHTGLQTVSWLLDGEVLHRDSLGSEQLIRPGELGLMTPGRAIAHAEQSPATHPKFLHGAQLWVALPDRYRHTAPAFEHHTTLPVVEDRGLRATVLLGQWAGEQSPGTTYSPLVGVDVSLSGQAMLPLEPEFEHAVLISSGVAEVDGVPLAPGSLLYLGTGRDRVSLRANGNARLLVLGGEPFEEQIVMWWNFVARHGDEVAEWRERWNAGEGFGEVRGYDGDPL